MKDRSTQPFDAKEGPRAGIGKAGTGPVRLATRFTRTLRRAQTPRPAPSRRAGEQAGWLR